MVKLKLITNQEERTEQNRTEQNRTEQLWLWSLATNEDNL
jgi:hypothetical protein